MSVLLTDQSSTSKPMPFFSLCERWWQSWLAEMPGASEGVRSRFDLNAAPEPYLPFEPGAGPLVVLTTNPGATMPHQHREQIMRGQSVVTPSMSYAEAADALSRFYVEHLSGAAAQRIAGQRAVATEAGYTGVLQVESCPWHSPKLPDKTTFIKLLAADTELAEYTQELHAFLEPRPVIAISAVSSRASLASSDIPLSPWLAWQRDLIGLRQPYAEMVPLVWKGPRITAAALVERRGGGVKALVLMQGGNHLPGANGRATLASALASLT
jgi:hypothetical protein